MNCFWHSISVHIWWLYAIQSDPCLKQYQGSPNHTRMKRNNLYDNIGSTVQSMFKQLSTKLVDILAGK